MVSTRCKDQDWAVGDPATGKVPSWERAGIAVLMDIRDELKRLNRLLWCPKFVSIPATLRRISRNTAKPMQTRKPRQTRKRKRA